MDPSRRGRHHRHPTRRGPSRAAGRPGATGRPTRDEVHRSNVKHVPEEEKSHDTPVLLDLRRSDRDPDGLEIHIHTLHGWTVGHQLEETLKEAGIETQFMGYAHDVTHTAITIAPALGGLAGLAAALNTFFQRHRHRKITVKTKNREVTVQGFSAEDTERLLKEALD